MWKSINGGLVPVTDNTRVAFRTNISKAILDYLNSLAIENDTHMNYLIENGLQIVLSQDVITFNKELRPKDRIQYKTTYDKELLTTIKKFAKDHNVFINDVIEYSTKFIDVENIKNKSFRHRIE